MNVMASATAAAFPPVGRTEHLERLAILADQPADAEWWDDVHETVQVELALLEVKIRRTVPGIRVDAGRTRGDRFHLFSYRTFSLPDGHVDPVVAGVTFSPTPNGVAVEADISGEQTGDWIVAARSTTVAPSYDALLKVAHDLARQLCDSAAAIATALMDSSRSVD
jgi:hypothetical protein